MSTRPGRLSLGLLLVGAMAHLAASSVRAHETPGHAAPTYEVTASKDPGPEDRVLHLSIVDDATRESIPARFSLSLDWQPWVPPFLSAGGIRFTSIHTAKKQRETVLYHVGKEGVKIPLPQGNKPLSVHVARGYQYLPVTRPIESDRLEIRLQRWSDLQAEGWRAADAHLHYERLSPDRDTDWGRILQAEGLDQACFMVLKGGNLPGTWAQQFAYGEKGLGNPAGRLLIPGEEFRGTAQGHNNLFGMSRVIEPISIGGLGSPPHRPNWPPMRDALIQAREEGGIGGPAHGGTFGKASTVFLDALLGASEFVELANTHLFETGPWYLLLDCGVTLPPMAGTDLPNFPYRETWQPFLGETRTFVRVEPPGDFAAWKAGIRSGQCFITSGPLIDLEIEAKGNRVTATATAASPQPIQLLEIVANGQAIPASVTREKDSLGIHRWKAVAEMEIEHSSWFAARAEGARKRQLWARTGILKPTIAHTAAQVVEIDSRPVRIERSVAEVRRRLQEQRTWYRENGTFDSDSDRDTMLALFDSALETLERGRR